MHVARNNFSFSPVDVARTRDGTSQDFLDPTGKFQNYRRLTGWSTGFGPAGSTGILQKVFVHCSMFLMKNFQRGGGHE